MRWSNTTQHSKSHTNRRTYHSHRCTRWLFSVTTIHGGSFVDRVIVTTIITMSIPLAATTSSSYHRHRRNHHYRHSTRHLMITRRCVTTAKRCTENHHINIAPSASSFVSSPFVFFHHLRAHCRCNSTRRKRHSRLIIRQQHHYHRHFHAHAALRQRVDRLERQASVTRVSIIVTDTIIFTSTFTTFGIGERPPHPVAAPVTIARC
jgi:hypothetical protein